MSYYAFEGLIPVVHPDAFVHSSAVLIGDVSWVLVFILAHSRHCVGIMAA